MDGGRGNGMLLACCCTCEAREWTAGGRNGIVFICPVTITQWNAINTGLTMSHHYYNKYNADVMGNPLVAKCVLIPDVSERVQKYADVIMKVI